MVSRGYLSMAITPEGSSLAGIARLDVRGSDIRPPPVMVVKETV